jgi:hypothetical protein
VASSLFLLFVMIILLRPNHGSVAINQHFPHRMAGREGAPDSACQKICPELLVSGAVCPSQPSGHRHSRPVLPQDRRTHTHCSPASGWTQSMPEPTTKADSRALEMPGLPGAHRQPWSLFAQAALLTPTPKESACPSAHFPSWPRWPCDKFVLCSIAALSVSDGYPNYALPHCPRLPLTVRPRSKQNHPR